MSKKYQLNKEYQLENPVACYKNNEGYKLNELLDFQKPDWVEYKELPDVIKKPIIWVIASVTY